MPTIRMLRVLLLVAFSLECTLSLATHRDPAMSSTPEQDALEGPITVPRTSYVIESGAPQLEDGSTVPRHDLIVALATWVASELGLQPTPELPRVVTASPTVFLSVLNENAPMDRSEGSQLGNVLAVYNTESRTIVLRDGWTGRTPAELSIVAHEMVHHLQNMTEQKFACPAEREEAAFAVQERWLALFGRNLLQDFEIDALTLLVRTHCGI
jgi:hypothetical protein